MNGEDTPPIRWYHFVGVGAVLTLLSAVVIGTFWMVVLVASGKTDALIDWFSGVGVTTIAGAFVELLIHPIVTALAFLLCGTVGVAYLRYRSRLHQINSVE